MGEGPVHRLPLPPHLPPTGLAAGFVPPDSRTREPLTNAGVVPELLRTHPCASLQTSPHTKYFTLTEFLYICPHWVYKDPTAAGAPFCPTGSSAVRFLIDVSLIEISHGRFRKTISNSPPPPIPSALRVHACSYAQEFLVFVAFSHSQVFTPSSIKGVCIQGGYIV